LCEPNHFFQISFTTFFNVPFKAGANVLLFSTYATKNKIKKHLVAKPLKCNTFHN
jgi:hypothetical protein